MQVYFGPTTDDQLKHRFMHHPPRGDQAERYSEIRAAACLFAMAIRDRTPVSPEQTRAFNAIDEAMMLANAAIARGEPIPADSADSVKSVKSVV